MIFIAFSFSIYSIWSNNLHKNPLTRDFSLSTWPITKEAILIAPMPSYLQLQKRTVLSINMEGNRRKIITTIQASEKNPKLYKRNRNENKT